LGLPGALSTAIVEAIGGMMTLLPYSSIKDELRRRTILLVEDEPFVREATLKIQENAGFVVFPSRMRTKQQNSTKHGNRFSAQYRSLERCPKQAEDRRIVNPLRTLDF
jgi:hypothetical protein